MRPQPTAHPALRSDPAPTTYAFSHPVGFYQKMQVLRGLQRLLDRNRIALGGCRRILDLGCGDGFLLRMLAELRGQSDGLVGIDRSPEQLRAARRRNPQIPYICGDLRSLPVVEGRCDLVTAFVSFMFLTAMDDLSRAAHEAHRALRPHGWLIVFDLVHGRKLANGARSATADEIIVEVERAGFAFCDRATCFRNVLGFRRLCTAYLPARLPMWLVLLLEHAPLSPANNVYLLFRKT